ncbi:MAG: PDZ domain-containing protein [Planctomycetota bacterium]
MKLALRLALVTGMLGALIGFLVARKRFATTPGSTDPASANNAPDGGKESPGGDELKRRTEELARSQQEAAALRRQLEAAQKSDGAKSATPEEIAAQVKGLRSRKAALLEARDGMGLLRLMQEFAALGEAGYADAMEISGLLREDLRGKNKKFGISRSDYFRAVGSSMVPLMKWALANPDKAPAAFRLDAAGLLRWQDLEAGPAYLEALKIETDARVAAEMARALRGMQKPEMAADLVAAARFQAANPDALRRLLDAISGLPSPEADAALLGLGSDPNPILREEASLAYTALNPPAPGVLITTLVPGSQADLTGLKRGDVIVSYDGHDLGSFKQLRNEVSKKDPDSLTSIVVNRNGQLVTLQLKGGKIGVNGNYVKPK